MGGRRFQGWKGASSGVAMREGTSERYSMRRHHGKFHGRCWQTLVRPKASSANRCATLPKPQGDRMNATRLPGYSESFAFCQDNKGRCHIIATRADRALYWTLMEGDTVVDTAPVGVRGLHLSICLDQQGRPCIAYLDPPHGIQVSRQEANTWVHQLITPIKSDDSAAWCSLVPFGTSELVLIYCLTENMSSLTDNKVTLRLRRLDATLQPRSDQILTEKAGWMPSMVIDSEGQVHILHNGFMQGVVVLGAGGTLSIPVYYTRFNLHTGELENREIAQTQNKHQGDIRLIDGRVEVVFSDLRDGKGYLYTMDCTTGTKTLAYTLPGLAKCIRFLGPDKIMVVQPIFANKEERNGKNVAFFPEVAALQTILLYKYQDNPAILPWMVLPFHKANHSKFFRLLEVIPDASRPLALLSSDTQTILYQLDDADFVMPPKAPPTETPMSGIQPFVEQKSHRNQLFPLSKLQINLLLMLLVVVFVLFVLIFD